MNTITVLMSTYNGEKYLGKQLDDILNQIDVEVKLVIRDDGSTDRTKDIIKQYIQRYPSKIKLISDGRNLGATLSYLELISHNYEDQYYALADQDDIWDKDKLITAIRQLDSSTKRHEPALYYSNLRIVDEKGSFIRNSHSTPKILGGGYSFLAEPLLTGCTAVYNQALAQIVKNTPSAFSMHDTYLFTVCALFGKLYYDFSPHISYRQHGNNEIGTYNRKMSFNTLCYELKKFFIKGKEPRHMNATILNQMFAEKMTEEQRAKVQKIVNYKDSIWKTIGLALDKDYNPANKLSRVLFKTRVLMRRI